MRAEHMDGTPSSVHDASLTTWPSAVERLQVVNRSDSVVPARSSPRGVHRAAQVRREAYHSDNDGLERLRTIDQRSNVLGPIRSVRVVGERTHVLSGVRIRRGCDAPAGTLGRRSGSASSFARSWTAGQRCRVSLAEPVSRDRQATSSWYWCASSSRLSRSATTGPIWSSIRLCDRAMSYSACSSCSGGSSVSTP